jgi:hypothetical protein
MKGGERRERAGEGKESEGNEERRKASNGAEF